NLAQETPNLVQILEAVGSSRGIDALIFQASFNWGPAGEAEERPRLLADRLAEARERVAKPWLIVSDPGREPGQVQAEQAFTALCAARRFPVFPTAGRAARAYLRALTW